MEKIFEQADFSAGSDHKKRLHDRLFSNPDNNIISIQAGRLLSEDELDQVAAGVMPCPVPKEKEK